MGSFPRRRGGESESDSEEEESASESEELSEEVEMVMRSLVFTSSESEVVSGVCVGRVHNGHRERLAGLCCEQKRHTVAGGERARGCVLEEVESERALDRGARRISRFC